MPGGDVRPAECAYYADNYLTAVAAGEVTPVPVLAVQGWTDSLFSAVEALQMYRKLKNSQPGYPLYMRFGDIGHLDGPSSEAAGELRRS